MSIFFGTMRAYPYIIFISMICYGFIFRNALFIYFAVALFCNIWVNKLLKIIFKAIMGDK